MADERWGRGYGSRRHLVAEPTFKSTFGGKTAQAQCSDSVFLSFFAEDDPTVMAATACSRCAKVAGKKVCPTCNGHGTVQA